LLLSGIEIELSKGSVALQVVNVQNAMLTAVMETIDCKNVKLFRIVCVERIPLQNMMFTICGAHCQLSTSENFCKQQSAEPVNLSDGKVLP
jgi:hypothetical protein